MKKGKFDFWLLGAVILISIFGILMIYSASSIWAEYKFNDSLKFVKSQSIFFMVSLILCLGISHISPSF